MSSEEIIYYKPGEVVEGFGGSKTTLNPDKSLVAAVAQHSDHIMSHVTSGQNQDRTGVGHLKQPQVESIYLDSEELQSDEDTLILNIRETSPVGHQKPFNREITPKDVQPQMRQLKPNTACNTDGLSPGTAKVIPVLRILLVTTFFNSAIPSGSGGTSTFPVTSVPTLDNYNNDDLIEDLGIGGNESQGNSDLKSRKLNGVYSESGFSNDAEVLPSTSKKPFVSKKRKAENDNDNGARPGFEDVPLKADGKRPRYARGKTGDTKEDRSNDKAYTTYMSHKNKAKCIEGLENEKRINDKKIPELNDVIAKQGNDIAELRDVVVTKDHDIAKLKDVVVTKDNYIAELEVKLRDRNTTQEKLIVVLQKENADLINENKEFQDMYEEILNVFKPHQ